MNKKTYFYDAFLGWVAIFILLIIFAGHLYFLYSANYKDWEYTSSLEENIIYLEKENAELRAEIELTHRVYLEKIGN